MMKSPTAMMLPAAPGGGEQEKSSTLSCPACGASLKVEVEAPEMPEMPKSAAMPPMGMGGGAKSAVDEYLK